MTVMVATLSQLLGLEQRVDEVDHQAHGHEPGERIIEDHASLLRDGRRRRRSRRTGRRRLGRWPAWRCRTLDAPGEAPLRVLSGSWRARLEASQKREDPPALRPDYVSPIA